MERACEARDRQNASKTAKKTKAKAVRESKLNLDKKSVSESVKNVKSSYRSSEMLLKTNFLKNNNVANKKNSSYLLAPNINDVFEDLDNSAIFLTVFEPLPLLMP